MSQLAQQLDKSGATAFVHPKHPRSICIINYKGGVGKTTITALLGLYLAQTAKKVLLFDIDAQCSLSLALGFNPEQVSKTDLTVYNLVEPKAWTKLKQKKLENYAAVKIASSSQESARNPRLVRHGSTRLCDRQDFVAG